MVIKSINKYLLLFVISFSSVNIAAQSSLPQVLSTIEKNNKALRSAQQSAQVQKIDAKTGIYLSDINVGYEYVRGNDVTDYQNEHELTVVQNFDFPTAYFQKNKIANMKLGRADSQYQITRRDILLEAKIVCIELVYLNKNKSIIKRQLENADRLDKLSRKRVEMGDATILEANKIALELLNVRNEARLNEVEINNNLQTLAGLNGGEIIHFFDTVYSELVIPAGYDNLLQKTLDVDPELKNLEQEKTIASKSVGLAKSLALPKFSLGYKMVISNPEKFHGLVAGVSIPLWENKNTVKKAKAEVVLADLQLEDRRLSQSNDLKQVYDKAMALKQSYEEYLKLLSAQNNSRNYLDKALSSGQMSLHEYFGEINFLYQSVASFLQIERDYYQALAELLKSEL
ncbi:TolC family protein [Viscerimonas tarda]